VDVQVFLTFPTLHCSLAKHRFATRSVRFVVSYQRFGTTYSSYLQGSSSPRRMTLEYGTDRLSQNPEFTHNPSDSSTETSGVSSEVFMVVFIQIMVFWFETLCAVLLVDTNVLELHVFSIFRVEVRRVRMWAGCIGMGSAQVLSPLALPWIWVPMLTYLYNQLHPHPTHILKMDAPCTYKMLVIHW
jgi:hypothetical protein